MASKCYVPACRTGYASDRKKRKDEGLKNLSLFRAPRDSNLFEEWKKAVPKADKELTTTDRICELHFQKDDIESQYVTKLPNGDVHIIERGWSKLKPDAVPTIFPSLPAYLSNTLSKRKVPAKRDLILKKVKKETVIYLQKETDPEHSLPAYLSETLTERKAAAEREPIPEKVKKETVIYIQKETNPEDSLPAYLSETLIKRNVASENDLIPEKVREETVIYLKTETDPDDTIILQPPFSLHELLNSVRELDKPNKWWGVTCHENFLVCIKWDKEFLAERKVVIDNNLNAKVFLYDKEVPCTKTDCINSVGDVSYLLKKIECYIICKGAKDGDNCCIYIQRPSSGRPPVWCRDCMKERKRALVCSKAIPLLYRYKSLYQKMICANRKITRLKRKIAVIKKGMKLTKTECFCRTSDS